MEETKTCSKCGKELPISEFYKNKNKKDGLSSYCKECNKQYYNDNSEYFKQYRKQYIIDNSEYHKQWYRNNIDHVKEYMKEYTKANSEHIKEYIKANSEHIKQHRKQYYKQRYSTLEGYALIVRLNNLRNDRKYGRCGKDEDPLPTIEQYIELLQQPDFYDGKQYHWSEMGLDRIDNSKPHTIDNVVPTTTEHNRQRGRKSFEEFCELIKD